MVRKSDEVAALKKKLEEAERRLNALEREMGDVVKLNALNSFLADYGRKAYFLFGPFSHDTALSKLERDSNWPWRELNRRCNFCGCSLFPAREFDWVPPMNTLNIDYEHTSREQMLEAPAYGAAFDPKIRGKMLRQPEDYLTFYYARGRKVPFGDYTVLYFHGPCFDTILRGKEAEMRGREAFLGSD